MDEKKERFESYISTLDYVADKVISLADEENQQNDMGATIIEIILMLGLLKVAFTGEIEETRKDSRLDRDTASITVDTY